LKNRNDWSKRQKKLMFSSREKDITCLEFPNDFERNRQVRKNDFSVVDDRLYRLFKRSYRLLLQYPFQKWNLPCLYCAEDYRYTTQKTNAQEKEEDTFTPAYGCPRH